MFIYLENPNRDKIVKINTGYNFKSLILGPVLPIIRKDYRGFVIQVFLIMVTLGISILIVPKFYNQRYITRLIEKGYAIKRCKEKDHFILRINNKILKKSKIKE